MAVRGPDPHHWNQRLIRMVAARPFVPFDQINHKPTSMMRHAIFPYLPVLALSLALIGSGTILRAQDNPAAPQSYVAHTTVRVIIPEGGNGKEFQDLYKEYFDKVVAKNAYIKHYSVLRHAWGSLGGSFVVVREYANWGDIEKANTEMRKLENAAWPDQNARKAFFAKFNSYQDMHHSDEIYSPMEDFHK